MSKLHERLDQALTDLIEAYTEIEATLEEKHGEDEDTFSHAIIEMLEGAIESATEDQGLSTQVLAAIFSNLNEALEQLDPSAFEEDDSDGDYMMSELDGNMDDMSYDMNDDDMD